MSEEFSDKISKKNDLLDRHRQLMQDYLKRKNNPKPAKYIPQVYKTERDIIRENHKFVRSEDEEVTWEQRVAKKYYDRLFKEYAICELTFYKEGKIALRWRTEKEVVVGKGQFICGSTRCESTKDLKSWEVNFGYIEDGEKKNELVKVRLCEVCSYKLNYKTMKRQAKVSKRKRSESECKKRKSKKAKKANSKRESNTDSDSESESDSNSNYDSESDKEKDKNKNRNEEQQSVWSKKAEIKEEKSKEEEFEDYFADLLQ